MKILAYRMFFHDDFCAALKDYSSEIVFFSSERRMDETGVIDRFYTSNEEADVADTVVTDIVIRCRYLSSLNFLEARKIARRMWAAVAWYFDNSDINLIVSPAVDNFVTDIYFRIASQSDIAAFQPRRSPLPNLVRITNSTDNPVLRKPDRHEVDAARKALNANFKADYQRTKIRSPLENFLKVLREIVKKPVFSFWKLKYRDANSFHYNAIFPNKNAITFKSIRQIWFHKRFKGRLVDLDERRKRGEKIVFWPLAMTPESALCYMNADSGFSDYSSVINRVVRGIPKHVTLAVKEHPSAIGFRNLEQYYGLLSSVRVVMMDPAVPTGKLIEKSDAVLINTSSTTGLEAVAMGKPVMAMGSCHYAVPGTLEAIETADQVSQWGDMMRVNPLSDCEIENVLEKYLSNTISGGTWAQHNVGAPDYRKKVQTTLAGCVELRNSGYLPKYHGK